MNTEKAECTLYPSYDTSVCLRPFKGQCSLAIAMEELGNDVRNNEFSPQSFLNYHTFTFLSLQSKELKM
jgi:hypothetical protein